MKAYVENICAIGGKNYRAVVQQGRQYFTIGEGTRDECQFMVDMFSIALDNHNLEFALYGEQ